MPGSKSDASDATWTVGPEFDGPHFAQLRVALTTLEYSRSEGSWGVAGSQELASSVWTGPSGSVRIEAETFIGLTVTGPAQSVAALRSAYDRAVG